MVAMATLSGCLAATRSQPLLRDQQKDEELSAFSTLDFLLKPQAHNEVGGIDLNSSRSSTCLLLCTQDK